MQAGSRKLSIRERRWLRLVALNRQPDFVNEENRQKAIDKVEKAEKAGKECLKLIKLRITEQNNLKRKESSASQMDTKEIVVNC